MKKKKHCWSSPTEHIQTICKLQAPPRILVFSWLTLKGKILNIDNLKKKGWSLVNMWYLCSADEESIMHLFHECSKIPQKVREIILICMFMVWRERCARIFRQVCKESIRMVQEVLHECRIFTWEWKFHFDNFNFCNFIWTLKLTANELSFKLSFYFFSFYFNLIINSYKQ
jgi:zinc-binding in reverse transcriptase